MNVLFLCAASLIGLAYLLKPELSPLILLLLGSFGLWQASDKVVGLAKQIAESLRLPHVLIGLTLVSIGTSIPEILTNIFSGIEVSRGSAEAAGIAVGTTIGSCLAQITLILGITGLVRNVHSSKRVLYRDGSMLLFAVIAVFILGTDGNISAVDGLLLLMGYFIYIIYISRQETTVSIVDRQPMQRMEMLRHLAVLAAGIALLLGSASLVVRSATALAGAWGIASTFIGVMIIGVCSALPELTTAVTGVLKDAHGISVGTLIGSNITNPMFALSIGAIISGNTGFAVDSLTLTFYLPYLFFASAFAIFLINRKQLILNRQESALLIACYLFFAAVSWKTGIL